MTTPAPGRSRRSHRHARALTVTLAQKLASLTKFAWNLTPEQVEEVFAVLREIPRESLGSGVAAYVTRVETVEGPRVEVVVFETADRSGPQLITQLPARATVSEDIWRKQVAHQYLLALQR